MNPETRIQFNGYTSQIATLNAVGLASEKFTVTPTIQQKLINKQQESSDFLKKINFITVDEMEGAVLGLSVSGTIAGRTNTAAGNRRQTKDPSGLDQRTYKCVKTDFDTHLTYAKLDQWAKFKDFQVRISNQLTTLQAHDRLRVGWYGTSVAVATNANDYPNLEDVNEGWLAKIRKEAPLRVQAGGKEAGKVTYGHKDADYLTLDALVFDALHRRLPSWAKDDPNLVVIVGSDLLHDKYFPMVNSDNVPTEQLALQVILSTQKLGGRTAVRAPFFPSDKILITKFDNLSIYQQTGKNRRMIKDVPEVDRVEDYQSSNDAYVIENTDYVVLIENIQHFEDETPEDNG